MGVPQAFNHFFDAIQALLNADTGIFVHTGRQMAHWFSMLALIYFGINAAQKAELGGGFSFIALGKLLAYEAGVVGLVTYYQTPVVWLGGYSFTGLITGFMHQMALNIGMAQSDLLVARLAVIKSAIEVPTLLDGSLLYILCYLLVWLVITVLEIVTFLVIGWGFFGEAVCILVGPLFIPFALVPRLDGFFWNWLRCFVQYSAFQVVGAAAVYIVANTILPAYGNVGAITGAQLIADITGMLAMFGIGVVGILGIPMLVSHMFSGSVGSNHGWLFAAASRLV